mmetsp:Transcript_93/g.439  ORF Transcript_93/g.439 Transcript_93/m.439 type:complete len:85 (+) Transcript_93:2159-2413(+)
MQPLSITKASFNGMPKSVTEIQCGTHTTLPFIERNDLCFIQARFLDGINNRTFITSDDALDILLLPFKKCAITNKSILHNFCKS